MNIGDQVMIRESVSQELQRKYINTPLTVLTIIDEIAGNSCDPVVGIRANTMEGAGGDMEYFFMRDLKIIK